MIRLTVDRYLDSHGISRYELSERAKICYHIVDKYYKNTVVRYDSDVLNRMCNALNCDISELIEYIKEDP